MSADRDALLSPLDRKWGRVVTVADWRAVGQKHVAQLSDDDLLILEAFAGPAARVEREVARDRWLTPQPPSVPVVTTTATKSAETKVPPAATLAEFVERFGTKPVTWAGLMKTLEGTDAIFIKEIRTLRQANKDLEARILELEASQAALKVGV